MSSPPQKKLPISIRLRASAAGVGIGILFGIPLAIGLRSQQVVVLAHTEFTTGLAHILLFAALIAGTTAAIVIPKDLRDRRSAVGIAVRKAVRAGIMSVLILGAIICHSARDAVLTASSAASETTCIVRMWLIFNTVLAVLLPSIVSSFVGGMWGAKIVAKRLPATSGEPIKDSSPWLFTLIPPTLIFFASLGVLSPASLVGHSPRRDPIPVQKRAPELPSEPEFHFVPSPGLSVARLGQYSLAALKTIDGIREDSPIAITADYSLLAVCDRSSGESTIAVFDLNRFKRKSTIPLPCLPNSNLAWSPDLKKLACGIDSNDGRRIWILDTDSGSVVNLPRPRNRDVPTGWLCWWSQDRIAFFPTDEPPLLFNLDELTLSPLKEYPPFKALKEDEQKEWLDGRKPTLLTLKRWNLLATERITSLLPSPRRSPTDLWQFKTQTQWTLQDPKTFCHQFLPFLPVEVSAKCFCTPDASKLLLLHNGKMQIAYMDVGADVTWQYSVEMPCDIEAIKDEKKLSQIKNHDVCTFACRPLVNPLNQRIIGADLDHIHGILRLNSWHGSTATFTLVQADSSLPPNTVVSQLHIWKVGSPLPWTPLDDKTDWWTSQVNQSKDEIQISDELQTPSPPTVKLTNGEYVVSSLRRIIELPTAPPSVPPPQVSQPASKPEPLPAPPSSKNPEVETFVLAHHRKASDGNVEGMMDDYADLVDFLDKGRILKDKIKKDEQAHRSQWPRGSETVQGLISTTQNGDAWDVSYTLAFRNENGIGDWQSGQADVRLQVKKFSAGLLIIDQKAKVHDLQKGTEAPRSRPTRKTPAPVKIHMPAPVWAATLGSFKANDGTHEIHDAVGLKGDKATIHRTYRVLVDSSTPKSIADQHPDGVIAMQTAEFTGNHQFGKGLDFAVTFTSRRWLTGSDAQQGNLNPAFETDASEMIGKRLFFHALEEDIEAGQVRFRLVKKTGR